MGYAMPGDIGMEVSRICPGCMGFGTPEWREQALDEETGLELVDRAIEPGINFFDTANMYPNDESECVLGKALEGRCDEAVVVSKVYFQMDDDDPNSSSFSRKAIGQELDNSLDCLRTDALDLLQIHRYDYDAPIETTIHALDDAVRRSKTHYVGASSMQAHQFTEAQYTAGSLGLDCFATVQSHYNLLYREEEHETLPLCEKQDVGVVPWSPLARGYLTRSYEEFEATTRGRADEHAKGHPYFGGDDHEVNEHVEELADEKGVKMAQLALSWVLHEGQVDAPIVGTGSIEYLEDAVKALGVTLSDSGIDCPEEPYQPVRVSGHD